MTEGERYLLEQRLQDLQAARRDSIAFEAEVGRLREEVGRLRELLKLALGALESVDIKAAVKLAAQFGVSVSADDSQKIETWASIRRKIEAELNSENSETGV